MKFLLFITLIILKILLLSNITFAAGGNTLPQSLIYNAKIDTFNTQMLIKGAENFNQYCLSCHSLSLMRFKRVMNDLELTEKQLQKVFSKYSVDNLADPILSVLDKNNIESDLKGPDLSLISRSKGNNYILNYLMNFYNDENQTYGSNNLLLKNASMPNVLVELSGQSELVHQNNSMSLNTVKNGQMTKREFYNFINDTVNFLEYVAEPTKTKRLSIGKYVIIFLILLAGLTYFTKKEYWKDIKSNKE